MHTHICLVRGINVGGHNIVKMAAWRTLYESLGFTRVRTLLQSGSILFNSPDNPPRAALAERLSAAFTAHFGFSVDHILRNGSELRAAMDANPFPDAATMAPNHLLVTFLAGPPSPDAPARLAALDTGTERVCLIGEVLYVHFQNGAGRSILDPARMNRALGVTGTARNWNSLGKLVAMANAVE